MYIVAHRGATAHAPENTLEAFRAALRLGADAVELDVRLSADGVPVVYHYAYLEGGTDGSGPVWQRTWAELRDLCVGGRDGVRMPRLVDVLDEFVGTPLGLEIELKGPEPEAVGIVGGLLDVVRAAWERIEVTSHEPALLAALVSRCPGLGTALLFPRSEAWMGPDVVAYFALHRARQAGARVVHLHPTQLSQEVVGRIRAAGIDVHAWKVNDQAAFELVASLGVDRICTDQLAAALRWRSGPNRRADLAQAT